MTQINDTRFDVIQQCVGSVLRSRWVIEGADDSVANSHPQQFERPVISRIGPDSRPEGGAHVHRNSTTSTALPVAATHRELRNVNHGIHVLDLEMRFSNDGDICTVTDEISSKLLHCMGFSERGSTMDSTDGTPWTVVEEFNTESTDHS